jgi:hypothetical protein
VALPGVRRTLAISCEAVPPSIWPAGAQGGTSACSTGAALSFVSCIALLGRSLALRVLRWPDLPGRVRLSNADKLVRMVLPVCTRPPQLPAKDPRIRMQ